MHQIVAINKIDAIDNSRLTELKKEFKNEGINTIEFSAVTGQNLETLTNEMEKMVNEIPKTHIKIEVEEDLEATNNDDNFWKVHKLDKNTYEVTGGKIIRISQVTNQKNTEQIIRLQNTMNAMGIMSELKNMGIQNGDTLIVGKLELEYWEDEVYK